MNDKNSMPSHEDLLQQCEARRVTAEGQTEKAFVTLLKEHGLELFLNGKKWRKIVCTRTDLRAMAVGRLYTEKLIGSASDIGEICFSEDEKRAEICLKAVTEQPFKQPRLLQSFPPDPPG